MASTEPDRQERFPPGRWFSIAAFVSAAVALLVLPVLFGPAGIALGWVGYAKGDRRVGPYAVAAAVTGMLVGAFFGYLVVRSRQNH